MLLLDASKPARPTLSADISDERHEACGPPGLEETSTGSGSLHEKDPWVLRERRGWPTFAPGPLSHIRTKKTPSHQRKGAIIQACVVLVI